MKDEFLGFYEPSVEEIDEVWTNGYFVFDANALLNLYRYTESTSKDFLAVISKLEEKLFLPYQVGLEYHRNRLSVIKGQLGLYSEFLKSIENVFIKDGPFAKALNLASRHPSIKIDKVKAIQEKFVEQIKEELEVHKEGHPDFIEKDTVLEKLTDLFKGKVGPSPSEEKLAQIYKEGENRYLKEIPPGYKDKETKKGKGQRRIYGDLIVWKEVIDFTKKVKKPIVLVTDDRKEDWWTIEKGETIRPREELIKEFFDLTGIRILIYSSDSFLKFAKSRGIIADLDDKSIEEVKEIRITEEERGYLKENFRPITAQDLINRIGYDINGNAVLSDSYSYPDISNWYNSRLGDKFPFIENDVYTSLDRELINSRLTQLSANQVISPYENHTLKESKNLIDPEPVLFPKPKETLKSDALEKIQEDKEDGKSKHSTKERAKGSKK